MVLQTGWIPARAETNGVWIPLDEGERGEGSWVDSFSQVQLQAKSRGLWDGERTNALHNPAKCDILYTLSDKGDCKP